jgi:hypothetical protein
MAKPELREAVLGAMDALWETDHAPILFDIVETLTRSSPRPRG